jgi:hypothetical protein
MRLPNANLAIVEREKITEYLLNPRHRYGGSKARFFFQFGFQINNWEVFAEALREHGQVHEVSLVRQTRWGPRYGIDGELNAPDGRQPRIRTVWQVDEGQIAPRLITAYPLEAEQ